MNSQVVDARAKVNLMLRVLDREASGYHRIATLFCALELADELSVTIGDDAPGVRLEVEGAKLGNAADNLVARAASAFLDAAGDPVPLSIRLVKRIPAGGGLGGGSSDAAATLLALDRLLPGRVPRHVLDEIGAELGSDVSFFMTGAPLAWGEGYGEQLSVLEPLASTPVLVAIPPFPVATAAAYGWLDTDREGAEPAAYHGLPASPVSWDDVAQLAVNDFERPVYRRHPELRAIRDGLVRKGARVALLAGSGSSVFGIFDDEPSALGAAEALRTLAPGVRIVETRTVARPDSAPTTPAAHAML